jgi:hypothetical protein
MGEGIANVLKTIVEDKVGKKAVGDGECFALVDMALKLAGAKSAEDFGRVTRNSDYVWGHAVTLDRVHPGDVLQFRNHVVKVRTETDTGWEERTYTRPHHTAVVVAVEGDGSVIVVEQKVKPDPKKVTRNVIARLAQGTETRSGTLEQNGVLHDAKITITVTGVVKAYRPVPKSKGASLFQRNVGPTGATRQMLARYIPREGGPKRRPGPIGIA